MKFRLAVVGTALLVTVAVVALALHFGAPLCGDQFNGEIVSPSGELRAVQFTRDCGATTAFSTQVSILPPGQEPKGAGNVFTADETHMLYLDWSGDHELVISFPKGLRTFMKKSEYKGVKIRYKELP